MGFRIYNNQLVDNNKKKNKYIKLINAQGQVLHTYQVDNFDNCYIPNQDSYLPSSNYIINGKVYMNTNVLIDSSGLCTCCDSKMMSSAFTFIKSGRLYAYNKISNRIELLGNFTNLVKVCGQGGQGTEPAMQILLDSNHTAYYRYIGYPSISLSNVVDICGQFTRANSWSPYGYYLTSSGVLYGGKGVNISKLATNAKKIYCCSDGNGYNGYSFISNDDTWNINGKVVPDLKVSHVTGGPYRKNLVYLYGIGLEDSCLYCVECQYTSGANELQSVTQISSSGWKSISATQYNTGALGIKNGKVYKIAGKSIQELPDLGNGNIKIEGVNTFLLYCQE